ncbi:glucose phosphomutase, putative [Candida dubliniensis CD36]|uniref:Phosphoglucomutase, putative n=1 Tax=Candida dubliniensis (strain CD36 / ATCC MYA-646 / CBS 7987 / NCPF 3949 / NRRL Y-17841) TaxID=573826 RepID=B9WEX3_CANDC|nr:glucose phosphomutase, putative [Candida dubliniensis CD36]CAX43236.1 glucose phosphomutase, putative [Candida dubliniensis CD36]
MAVDKNRLDNLVESWLSIDINPESRQEIEQLHKNGNYEQLDRKLSKRIAFGTAGLRSSMESGFSHMNDVTVLQASQGLIKYLLKKTPASIVIGYDHRFNSQRFAEILASVALTQGVQVYYLGSIENLSEETLKLTKADIENDSSKDRGYVHTPLVPFAIDYYGASGGVMITASHNPANDNGYKVYYSNGCQIIPPVDKEIADSIEENLVPWEGVWDVYDNIKKAKQKGLLSLVRDEVTKEYLKGIKEKLIQDNALDFEFVYTPMHGVGYKIFSECLQLFHASNWKVVYEQAHPDPAFPTVSFPNPEEKGALDLAILTAQKLGYKLVIANDPDADRFSVAVETKGQWKQLTGNEIGFLFAMYVIEQQREQDLGHLYLVNSTVSSQILKAMADKDGFHFQDTLTGFKWIGNKAIDLQKQGFKVPFGYEEAIGFMFDLVHDKDGISAATIFLQLYQKWFSDGKIDVTDKLEAGYAKYGWFKDYNGYYRLADMSTLDKIFGNIRSSFGGEFPKSIGQFEVISWRDLTVGYDSSTVDHSPVLPVDSSSQMITASLKLPGDDNAVVRFTCRGSGTEPKLKLYIEGKSTVDEQSAKEISVKCWEILKEQWFQPEKYNLIENKP